MTETKVLDKISSLVDKINYKSVYIEIQTEKDKYTLEKEKRNKIGFWGKNLWQILKDIKNT